MYPLHGLGIPVLRPAASKPINCGLSSRQLLSRLIGRGAHPLAHANARHAHHHVMAGPGQTDGVGRRNADALIRARAIDEVATIAGSVVGFARDTTGQLDGSFLRGGCVVENQPLEVKAEGVAQEDTGSGDGSAERHPGEDQHNALQQRATNVHAIHLLMPNKGHSVACWKGRLLSIALTDCLTRYG